jgi:hypothetical protein
MVCRERTATRIGTPSWLDLRQQKYTENAWRCCATYENSPDVMKERSLHLLCAQQMYRFAITAFAGDESFPSVVLDSLGCPSHICTGVLAVRSDVFIHDGRARQPFKPIPGGGCPSSQGRSVPTRRSHHDLNRCRSGAGCGNECHRNRRLFRLGSRQPFDSRLTYRLRSLPVVPGWPPRQSQTQAAGGNHQRGRVLVNGLMLRLT